MGALRTLTYRLRALLQRDRLEQEMEEELRLHLELQAEENRRRGLTAEEAARAARLSLGGLDQTREEVRDSWGVRALEMLVQDVRYGLRNLRRDPTYVAAVLVTLALGIGANTAVFSVVNAVLLKPLPYERGEELVVLRQPERASGSEDVGLSVGQLQDYREQARTLDGLVEYHTMNFTLFGGPEPRRVRTGVVSANFFDVLKVKPLLGRTFLPGEDGHGAEAVLVLAHDYWRELGGDPGIVGRRFEMNDRVHTVVGVLPPLPEYPNDNDVFMPSSACPFRSRPDTISNRQARMLTAFGRLKPGVTLAEAQADLAAVAGRMRAAHPEDFPRGTDPRTSVSRLQDDLVRQARPTFLVLLATVGLVLLIACANVANLALARLAGRSRELAVRAALGAGRVRLLRQLATEATLLALVGGGLGLVFAAGLQEALSSFALRFTPRAQEIHIDSRVLLFTLGLSLVTGVLAGTLPGLPDARRLALALAEGSGRSGTGHGQSRLRATLVVWQLALSFMLLIGASLMLRSFAKLQAVHTGFQAENVLTMGLDLNFSRYTTSERKADQDLIAKYYASLHETVRALPGVVQVAEAWTFPLNNRFRNDGTYLVEGQDPASVQPKAAFLGVSPEYFDAVGMPLLRGRRFTDADRGPDAPVILSQGAARRTFGDTDPVGRRVSVDDGKTWSTIVGVVGDVRQRGLDRDPSDALYVPFAQYPGFSATFFVRSLGDPTALSARIRAAARQHDPQTAVSNVRTFEEIRKEALSQPRLTTLLLGLFAVVALGITAAGLSGLLAYSVSQRTREIGIRMALGAEPRRVQAMVLGEGLSSVGIGLGLGLLGALALSRLVSGLLFGVAPTDPLCFVGSAAVLSAVAAGACLLPARRATAIDPMIAVRAD